MKNLIEAKAKRFLSCLLVTTLVATGVKIPGQQVYASEEGAYTEEETVDEPETTEKANAETEETQEKTEEESKKETVETEEPQTEESESVSIEEDDIEEQVTLEAHSLSAKTDAGSITVQGKMPEDAKLSVKTKKISERMKRELADASDIVTTVQDLEDEDIFVYSYDISIMHRGEEYEPYLFDETMEVTMEFSDAKEIDKVEIFHVSSETARTEQLSLIEKRDNGMVFTTDHFSQFIFIANTTYKKQTVWNYAYTGKQESLTIPSTGIYEIRLYGAQGEHSSSYEGGKGGYVSGLLSMQKNDVLSFQIAGKNGYPDAGTGAETHGGGATRVYVNGNLAAVAGGGGGALVNRDGGFGGTSLGKVTQSQGESSDVAHSAGGGAGYQGGKSGFVIYHAHTGNNKTKGGCYTKEVYHSHTQACFGVVCSHRNLKYIKTFYDEKGEDYSDWECLGCGRGFVSNTSYGEPSPSPTYGWTCKKDKVIESYDLGCGMTTQTIIDSTASYGGSNYLSSLCEEGISQAGINEGDGKLQVSLKKLDCATLYYENDGKEFKTYQIERGTEFEDIFTDTPLKKEDERYSYTFLGWDNLATSQVETMPKEETIKGIINGNRNFSAVYQKNPQTYVLHFENEEKVPHGTKSISATYNSKMDEILVPQKEGYIFAGYYMDVTDEATRYFDAYGKPVRYSDFTRESTLTAKWENPLYITKSPTDQTVTAGYSGVVLTMGASLSPANGYQLSYQWYVNTKKDIAGAKEIETGFTDKLLVPQDYAVGDYYFFAKAVATGSVDQTVEKYTDIACLHVTKGTLDESRLQMAEKRFTYDGTFHELKASVKNEPKATIYYGKEPLNEKNYKTLGSKTPMSFKDAGEYQVYVYVVSENYDDFSDTLVMTVDKAAPEIYIASKNTTYRENTIQSIDEAVVFGVDKKILTDMSISYTYYTDEKLKQKTQKEQGARTIGGAPSAIGTYYVSAKVEESKNYKAAETPQSAMLNILGTHVSYTVGGYVGIYDGKPHGIQVLVNDTDRVSFYYAKDKELTEDNYLEKGSEKEITFTDAGEYTVYYAAANKLTNNLFSVDTGSAKVIIKKAARELDNRYPTVNPDHTLKIPQGTQWEYKKQDGKTKEWTLYKENEVLPDGSYEVRIPEDKNYEASVSITLQVGKKPGNGTGGDTVGDNGGNNGGSSSDSASTDRPKPATDKKPNYPDTGNNIKNPQFPSDLDKTLINETNKEKEEKKQVSNANKKRFEKEKSDKEKESQPVQQNQQMLSYIEPQPVAVSDAVETIAFPQLEKEVLLKLSDQDKDDTFWKNKLLVCSLTGFIAGALAFGLFFLFFLFWKKKKEEEKEEISKTEKLW